MEREYPPWRWPAAVECRRQREGGLLGQTGTLANHRKLWDCKAMGTKASNSWSGAMLARLLDTSKPFEKTGHKATGPTAVFLQKTATAAQPPDTLHPKNCKERPISI